MHDLGPMELILFLPVCGGKTNSGRLINMPD